MPARRYIQRYPEVDPLTDQFIRHHRIDVEADTLCAPDWRPQLAMENHSPYKMCRRGGGFFLQALLHYRVEKSLRAIRVVRVLVAGKQTELMYLSLEGDPKTLTVNQGSGQAVVADPITQEVIRTPVSAKKNPIVDIEPGSFYAFTAPRNAGSLTVSELYMEPFNVSDTHTICNPGAGEGFTHDGIIDIPPEYQELYQSA